MRARLGPISVVLQLIQGPDQLRFGANLDNLRTARIRCFIGSYNGLCIGKMLIFQFLVNYFASDFLKDFPNSVLSETTQKTFIFGNSVIFSDMHFLLQPLKFRDILNQPIFKKACINLKSGYSTLFNCSIFISLHWDKAIEPKKGATTYLQV